MPLSRAAEAEIRQADTSIKLRKELTKPRRVMVTPVCWRQRIHMRDIAFAKRKIVQCSNAMRAWEIRLDLPGVVESSDAQKPRRFTAGLQSV